MRAARRDLDRKRFQLVSGHRSAVRRKCRRHNSSTEKKNRFARSARTQRSVRSRRRIRGRVVGKYGVVGKTLLVQCRADSVKHVASPSRRDFSQRAIHVASDSTSVRRSRTSRCPAPLRRVPQSVPVQTGFELGPTPLQAPRSYSLAVVRCVFPRSMRILRLREIWAQDSRSHIAMSYRPSFAWKASLRAHRRRFARPLRVLKPRWS